MKMHYFTIFGLLILCIACGQTDMLESEQTANIANNRLISLQDAENNLTQIFEAIENSETRSENKFKRPIVSNSYSCTLPQHVTRSDEDLATTQIHIINFENEEGYAIMSGDASLPDMLALSFEGNIQSIDSLYANDGVDLWLESIADYYIDNSIESTSRDLNIDDRTEIIRTVTKEVIFQDMINDGCSVKWGQSPAQYLYNGISYNYYTPLYNGVETPTGCIATAIAQLMSIYGSPNAYDGYLFDWEAMTSMPLITQLQYSENKLQIAKLLYYIGLEENVDATYKPNNLGGTSAVLNFAPRTFENFGYSNGGTHYSQVTNQDIIKELKKGYPILIRGGIDEDNSKGHAWLAHGLMTITTTETEMTTNPIETYITTATSYYVKNNWGLHGSYDGYYLVGNYDTTKGAEYDDDGVKLADGETFDYNFKYDNEAILGIRK
ncbi:MAG: C10 family peptidase [Rikenellaceae bacterium]